MPDEQESPRTDAPGLLEAARAVAAVMRYGGMSWLATAERLESYDSQPYPLTYVIMSNHAANLLKALAYAEGQTQVRVGVGVIAVDPLPSEV